MATIGFLRFDDFLSEVAGTTAPVRVEAYHRSTPSKHLPLEFYNFFVECASVVGDDTVVFRFQTGQCQHMGDVDNGKLDERQRRSETAALAIQEYLEGEGLDVRPGLIAAAEESKTAGEMPKFVRVLLRNGIELKEVGSDE